MYSLILVSFVKDEILSRKDVFWSTLNNPFFYNEDITKYLKIKTRKEPMHTIIRWNNSSVQFLTDIV